MPVYLLHGFRWPRELIRIHIILQNLDDAAAEWLIAPETSRALLNNFHELYPGCMDVLRHLRFIEQYDPHDTSPNATSQPHAYVADAVEEVKLGVDVDDIRGRGIRSDEWAAMAELRNKIAPDEKIAWYIVVCGDEERTPPYAMGRTDEPIISRSALSGSEGGGKPVDSHHSGEMEEKPVETAPAEAKPKGLSKLFGSGRLRRRKSRISQQNMPEKVEEPIPVPVPPIPASFISPTPPRIPLDPTWQLPAPPPIRDRHEAARGRSPAPVDSARVINGSDNSALASSKHPSSASTAPRSSESPRRAADSGSIAGSTSRSIRRPVTPSTGKHGSPLPPSRRPPTPPPDDSGDDRGDDAAPPPDVPRKASPARRMSRSSTLRNSSPFSQPADRTSKRVSRRFSLNTKSIPASQAPPIPSSPLLPPPSNPVETVPAKEDEFEDVITMAPVTRAPVHSFRRPRSLYSNAGRASSLVELSTPLPSSMSMYGDRSSILSAPLGPSSAARRDKPYFGQNISSFDLVANNIENAFKSMK